MQKSYLNSEGKVDIKLGNYPTVVSSGKKPGGFAITSNPAGLIEFSPEQKAELGVSKAGDSVLVEIAP